MPREHVCCVEALAIVNDGTGTSTKSPLGGLVMCSQRNTPFAFPTDLVGGLIVSDRLSGYSYDET